MGNGLQFQWGYYDQSALRGQLNTLVRTVFQLDFAAWNELEPSGGAYTPFSYLHGRQVVANVSASPMELTIGGKPMRAIQIGTVATLRAFRGQGLVRDLMARAHAHWDRRCHLAFLFANESASGVYQRFGYRPVTERTYQFSLSTRPRPARPAQRLDLFRPNDAQLLRQLADDRVPVSSHLGVRRHTWLLLFHAAVRFSEGLSYIEDLDAVVLHRRIGNTLFLADVVARSVPLLSDLLPHLPLEGVKRLEFGFVPDQMGVSDVAVATSPDSHLFVRGQFPIENTPFRFPETSQA